MHHYKDVAETAAIFHCDLTAAVVIVAYGYRILHGIGVTGLCSVHRMEPAVYTGRNLVLIVACPRSGTTWLHRLLASHPKIRSGEESHFFSMYVGPQLRAWKIQAGAGSGGNGSHLVGPPAYLRQEDFLRILRNYTSQLLKPVLERLAPDELFVEKTPSHALFIPEIKQILPETRIIHILRDPRDVVASLLAAGRGWGSDWAPATARAAAHMWVEHVNSVKQATKDLSGADFCEIRYESLWSNTENTLAEVSKFLNLDWSKEEIRRAVERNRAEIMNKSGTPIPLYGELAERVGAVSRLPEGFIRRARPGGWKTDLSLREKFQIWRVVSKDLDNAEYHLSLRDWL